MIKKVENSNETQNPKLGISVVSGSLPSVDEAGVMAVKISEMVEPPLTAQEQSFFIAGFCECVKWLGSNDRQHLLSAVASIEQIEEVARQYFEAKYPLMDLSNDEDKCEIDWWDMLQFVQHVLSCHCHNV